MFQSPSGLDLLSPNQCAGSPTVLPSNGERLSWFPPLRSRLVRTDLSAPLSIAFPIVHQPAQAGSGAEGKRGIFPCDSYRLASCAEPWHLIKQQYGCRAMMAECEFRVPLPLMLLPIHDRHDTTAISTVRLPQQSRLWALIPAIREEKLRLCTLYGVLLCTKAPEPEENAEVSLRQ